MDKTFLYKKNYIKYKIKYNNIKNNLFGGSESIKAIAFYNGDTIKGTVNFIETGECNEKVRVEINLLGFEPNTIHGFHVHESGDLTKGCESMCAHFNPYNKNHGGREDENRHVGDLGNLEADKNGEVNLVFEDNIIKLRGNDANIIGRGLIIHQDKDDCGKGNNDATLINGNAGKRIACSIIGYKSV